MTKNMKKKLTIITIAILAVGSLPLGVSAANAPISPDSNLYFLKTAGESERLALTFSNDGKVDYLLQLADRRVDELKSYPEMASGSVGKVAERYDEHFARLEQLENELTDKAQASEKMREASLRQQEILAEVYQNAPPEALPGLFNAQENSAKHVFQVVEKTEGREAAKQYVARIRQIQQMQQVKRQQRMPQEGGGPAADPSKTPLNSLNSSNSLNAENQLNSLNQLNETNNGAEGRGEAPMQPAAPAQFNSPAGQN